MASQIKINGNRWDFASVSITMRGERYYNISSISYGQSLEVGTFFGTAREAIGRSLGQMQNEDCSLTILKEDASSLIEALGDGYMEQEFTITVAYGNDGQPVTTDQLVACRITGMSDNHSSGSEPLTVDMTIHFMRLTRNGLRALRDPIQTQPVQIPSQGGNQ